MCPDHRKRQQVLLRQEAVITAAMLVLLAALGVVLYLFDGLAQWLGTGTLTAVGTPVLWLLHRHRSRQINQLEHDCHACRACAAAL